MVWGSIRLAWMVLGWFVMVSGLGGTGPLWMVIACFETLLLRTRIHMIIYSSTGVSYI